MIEPRNRHCLPRGPKIRRRRATTIGIRTFQFGSISKQIHHRFNSQPYRALGICTDVIKSRNQCAIAEFDHDAKRRIPDGLVSAGDLAKRLFERRGGRWRNGPMRLLSTDRQTERQQDRQAKSLEDHDISEQDKRVTCCCHITRLVQHFCRCKRVRGWHCPRRYFTTHSAAPRRGLHLFHPPTLPRRDAACTKQRQRGFHTERGARIPGSTAYFFWYVP